MYLAFFDKLDEALFDDFSLSSQHDQNKEFV